MLLNVAELLIKPDYTEPLATSNLIGLSRSPYLCWKKSMRRGYFLHGFMKVCKANLYIFVTLVEKPDLLIYCDTSTFESTITDMAIAAVIYISVSVLLVISAGIFFVKAIHSLMDKKQPSNYKLTKQVMFLRPKSNDPLAISSRREEIIAILERQFASSPSSDS